MPKKPAPKKSAKPACKVADEMEEIIQRDIISDTLIPWEDCVSQLEQIAEFCANWAETIREEHKDD